MLKIAICDDEKIFREKIETGVQEYMSVRHIECMTGSFCSGEELLKQGNRIDEYDIIFLDVDMGEMNGIETAKEVREYNQDAYITFVTAYFEYSLEGYKVNAIRYIIKNNTNLIQQIDECLDEVLKRMQTISAKVEFDFREGKMKIAVNKILYIESELHKLNFYIEEREVKKYTMYKKLDEVESKLQNMNFIRIHKSFLVNMSYIENISGYKLILKNGKELIIPKTRYREVKDKFTTYKGEVY